MKRIIFTLLVAFPFLLQAQDMSSLNRKRHDPLCVSYSKDATLIATGGSDTKVIVWDAASKEVKYELKGHAAKVLDVEFSPDGELLASCGLDQTIIVWNTNSGILDKIFTGHLSAVTSIVFSPDGQFLYSACADGTIGVWDVYKNMKISELRGHKAEVSSVAINKSGTLLASSSYDESIKIWDLDRKSEKATLDLKGGRVRAVAFSPDGEYLAATSDDKAIRVVNLENHEIVWNLRGHKKLIYSIEYSKDGQYMFTGAWDGTIRVWDTFTGELKHYFDGMDEFLSLSVSIDGKSLAAAGLHYEANLYDLTFLGIEAKKPHITKRVYHVSDNQVEPIHNDPNFNKNPPQLNVVAPNLEKMASRGGEEFILHFEKDITIKGDAKQSKNKIYEIFVNDVEVGADEFGNFSYDLKLGFGNNPVTIKTVDIYDNVQEKKFIIKRQYRVVGMNDTIRPSTDYALVICTDEYDDKQGWGKLSNPVSDGQEISRILMNDYGYKVETLFNPTRKEIYSKLKEYCRRQFNKDDQLFIFIAGHGDYDDAFKEGYIVPKDAAPEDVDKESYIAHSNLRTIIDHIPCEHVLLAMDVCFGGSFDPYLGARSGSAVTKSSTEEFTDGDNKQLSFIRKQLTPDTRRYITSGGLKYVPDGRPGSHSPFASKVIEALKNGRGDDRILTYKELWRKVQEVADIRLDNGQAAPDPWSGPFGSRNQPGSDFLFILK